MRRKEHSQRHLLWEFRVQSRERTKLNAASRLAMRGEREEDRESVGKVDQERQTTERTSHKRRAWRGWDAGEGSLWTSWFLLAHLGQGQESLDCSLLLPFFFFLFSFFFSFFFFRPTPTTSNTYLINKITSTAESMNCVGRKAQDLQSQYCFKCLIGRLSSELFTL